MVIVMVMIVMVMMLNVIGDDFTFHPPEQGWSSIWSDKCSTRPFLHCGNGELFTFTFQIIFHLCSFWQKSNIHFHCLSYFIIACCNSQYQTLDFTFCFPNVQLVPFVLQITLLFNLMIGSIMFSFNTFNSTISSSSKDGCHFFFLHLPMFTFCH